MNTGPGAEDSGKPTVVFRGKAVWWIGFCLFLLVLTGIAIGIWLGIQRFEGYEGSVLEVEDSFIEFVLSDGLYPSSDVTLKLDDGHIIRRSVKKDAILKERITVGTRIRKDRGFFNWPKRVENAP